MSDLLVFCQNRRRSGRLISGNESAPQSRSTTRYQMVLTRSHELSGRAIISILYYNEQEHLKEPPVREPLAKASGQTLVEDEESK